MSQIAAIGNVSAEQLKRLLALGPLREITEKRFGIFSRKRFENPTGQLLDSLLEPCTDCSGAVFVRLSEDIESMAGSRYVIESNTLSAHSGTWVEVFAPAEIPALIAALKDFNTSGMDEEDRTLIAKGVEWFIAHSNQCPSDQICVFQVS